MILSTTVNVEADFFLSADNLIVLADEALFEAGNFEREGYPELAEKYKDVSTAALAAAGALATTRANLRNKDKKV